jgi:uncharacterized protein YcfJ
VCSATHQVGSGGVEDLATVIAAIGGACAGNRVENSRDKRLVHRVMEEFGGADGLLVAVSTRVKVENVVPICP